MIGVTWVIRKVTTVPSRARLKSGMALVNRRVYLGGGVAV
jgi:hypothetical protein